MPSLTVLEIRNPTAPRPEWVADWEIVETEGLLGLGEALSSGGFDVVVVHEGTVEVESLIKMTALPVLYCVNRWDAEVAIRAFRTGVCDVVRVEELVARCLEGDFASADPLDSLLTDEGSWLLHADLLEREKLATLGELATGMAHSINNPAAWVVTNLNELQLSLTELYALLESSLELVRESGDSERVQEIEAQAKSAYYPQNIQDMRDMITESLEGMRRIRDIVGDLKGFQRADEDEWMPTNVSKALGTAVEMAKSQMILPVKIDLEITDCPPINASPGRLAQAFLNVLLNAIQSYGSQPKPKASVSVSCTTDSGRVCVRVQDLGTGIPEDQISRVFDPFFTLHESKGSTGLGLAISREIIHRHGGEIQVQSEEGVGTTVEIQLPVPVQFQQEPAEKEVAEEELSGLPRILLVDDEPPMTRAIRRVLKGLGEITVTHSAFDAREQIQSEAPDLILCDLYLPDQTGMELFEEVCSARPELEERFLFLTGGAKEKKGEQFLEEHADQVIEKPFDSEDLRQQVETRLN